MSHVSFLTADSAWEGLLSIPGFGLRGGAKGDDTAYLRKGEN